MIDPLKNLRVVSAPPTVIRDRKGRLVIIDDAVLAPMRNEIPVDEPLQVAERAERRAA
jgi:hypothetical protein